MQFASVGTSLQTLDQLALEADGVSVVLHCFSMPERLDECVQRGYAISFACNVTYKSATELTAAARLVPDDRLPVETDAPYLAPQPMRGKRNVPANVVHTAQAIALERRVSYHDFNLEVEAAAAAIFGW